MRIHQENALSLSARFEIPPSTLRGIFMAYNLVTLGGGGSTIAITDLGTFQYSRNGVPKSFVDVAGMININQQEMGATPVANVVGISQNARFYVYIPFHDWKDTDTELVMKAGDANEVLLNFPNLSAAIVASGTVTVYGVLGSGTGLTSYETFFNNHHLPVGGAGTLNFPIRLDNVGKLYIENDATVLSQISVIKDGKPFIEQMPRLDAVALGQLLLEVETYSATNPFIVFDLNTDRTPEGAASSDVSLIVGASAAGTLDVIVQSLYPTPAKLAESVRLRNAVLTAKATRKEQQSIPAAANYLKAQII